MKTQHTVQLSTYGTHIASSINLLLDANPEWRLTNIFGVDVARIGGPDKNVIAVFECSRKDGTPGFRDDV